MAKTHFWRQILGNKTTEICYTRPMTTFVRAGDSLFRLKELRESRHMSQQELGDLVGLSKSSIGYYEQGKHQPDLNTLETLA